MATKKKPENAGGKQDTKFKPGQSGNPAGKPPGTRHKATLAAELLLDGESEKLTRKAVELAMEGNTIALRLCLERILPPRKDRPVSISLPKIEKLADASAALEAITKAISDGNITPTEAQTLASMIENYRRTVETVELEQRISNLERKAK